MSHRSRTTEQSARACGPRPGQDQTRREGHGGRHGLPAKLRQHLLQQRRFRNAVLVPPPLPSEAKERL